ncbi:hypothetical protein PAHAL_6G274300 [Panicum hallii]|uniref:Uncharacterized protein n=1 Tax=Panicum hallii TaxID=206008 RepID=A0A2T8IHT3_9POAL|nr:hypothetical protein PAHAL_6G274300 [Panicum hallii]
MHLGSPNLRHLLSPTLSIPANTSNSWLWRILKFLQLSDKQYESIMIHTIWR